MRISGRIPKYYIASNLQQQQKRVKIQVRAWEQRKWIEARYQEEINIRGGERERVGTELEFLATQTKQHHIRPDLKLNFTRDKYSKVTYIPCWVSSLSVTDNGEKKVLLSYILLYFFSLLSCT